MQAVFLASNLFWKLQNISTRKPSQNPDLATKKIEAMQHKGLLKIMHECTLYLLDQPKYMNFFLHF